MIALDLREFAEQLRIEGDGRRVEFADEILGFLNNYEKIDEFENLCRILNDYTTRIKDEPEKQIRWIGDRSDLFAEIEETLKENGRTNEVDDEIKELLATLENAEEALRAHGHWTEGEFLDALQILCERPKPLEYDL